MGDRVNNMNKMMQDPKQRNMYLSVIALVVVTLGAGFWFASRGAKNNQAPAGAAVSAVPQVQSSPGTSTNPEYNQKVQESNKERANAALEQGKTAIPVLTNTGSLSDKSPLDLLEKQPPQKPVEVVQAPVEQEIIPTPPVAAPIIVPPPAPAPMPVQVAAPAPKKYGSMEDYMLLSTLSSAWKVKAPSSEYDYARTKDTQSQNNAGNGYAGGGYAAGNQTSMANSQAVSPLPLAKAGTIFNAILETGINSDEPSPVLAKIISGDLKGARLIGQINRVGEKVVIQFSSISLPTAPSSVRLSAVAIDAETSRTALASEVNNHYFQKYGIMMAAAFLGGYANALGRQNTTTIVDPTGGATIVQGELSSKDINRQAVGNVGKEISEQVRSDNQNLKPTVKVHEGIAIGILLMDDLIVR